MVLTKMKETANAYMGKPVKCVEILSSAASLAYSVS